MKIRTNCFWYRPWHDMSATIDQCDLADTAECPCTEYCKWYISKDRVDELVWAVLQRETCDGCIHETKGPSYYCDNCKRNWEDRYEKE